MSIRVVSIMEADFVTGPAKNLIQFAQRARPAVDLSVVAYLRGAQPETEFIRAARAADLEVDIVHERGRFDRSVAEALRDLAERRHPDLVQTHNSKSHFFLRLSRIWRERPWLAFHHGHTTTDFKMRVYHQVDRWSLRAARHVLTVCRPFAEQLANYGVSRERISILHNSVRRPAEASDAEVRRVRESLPAAEGTPILVSIGRLSREKGHVDLIRALARLSARGLPFHLVIVGEGPERGRIEAELRGARLDAHVTLAGLQHDVRPYYALADVVAMPSHSEGSPNVLLEAMVHGRAIVATRVGGVPEIAEHEKAALLVEARDPEAMAQAIARLLGDGELRSRLGSCASRIAATTYSPEAYSKSLTGLYERLTEARERA